MAKKQESPAPEDVWPTKGVSMAVTLEKVRAERIRAAAQRVPRPCAQDIAMEVGCSIGTVHNILQHRTHAP